MENYTTEKLFFENSSLDWEQVGEGVTRAVIAYYAKAMLVKVAFEKGAVGAVHHHFHTQISYVEKGVFEVHINDEIKILPTGNSFYVPPNAPHGVLCLKAGVLIDMFSPMREDFLAT